MIKLLIFWLIFVKVDVQFGLRGRTHNLEAQIQIYQHCPTQCPYERVRCCKSLLYLSISIMGTQTCVTL
jgi:hypothetical protein